MKRGPKLTSGQQEKTQGFTQTSPKLEFVCLFVCPVCVCVWSVSVCVCVYVCVVLAFMCRSILDRYPDNSLKGTLSLQVCSCHETFSVGVLRMYGTVEKLKNVVMSPICNGSLIIIAVRVLRVYAQACVHSFSTCIGALPRPVWGVDL